MNYTLHQLRFLKITQTKSITRAAEMHPHATCSFYSTTEIFKISLKFTYGNHR
jgi:hypothetical protein